MIVKCSLCGINIHKDDAEGIDGVYYCVECYKTIKEEIRGEKN